MNILVLKKEDIEKVFTMKDAIQADKDALEFYSAGQTLTPLRVNLDVPKFEGQSLYMPGYVEGASALGVKVVSTYPKNIEKGLNSVPAAMIMVNEETGEVASIMDGTYLTRIRTGAVSGAATDILAKKDAKNFLLFGTGGQAESQLEAVLNVRDIEEVKVSDLNRDRALDFAQRMTERFQGKFKARIQVADDLEKCLAEADIITTVTSSRRPTFDGRLVSPGCHINAVGSYTPEMQELDSYILTDLANKIYVDTMDGVINESGDLIIPIKEGIFSQEEVTGELGQVILGTIKGRESDDEVTLFKTTGSAVLDVVTGQRIFEKAEEAGVGTRIEL